MGGGVGVNEGVWVGLGVVGAGLSALGEGRTD